MRAARQVPGGMKRPKSLFHELYHYITVVFMAYSQLNSAYDFRYRDACIIHFVLYVYIFIYIYMYIYIYIYIFAYVYIYIYVCMFNVHPYDYKHVLLRFLPRVENP